MIVSVRFEVVPGSNFVKLACFEVVEVCDSLQKICKGKGKVIVSLFDYAENR